MEDRLVKLGCIKTKIFSSVTDAVKRMRRQATDVWLRRKYRRKHLQKIHWIKDC